MHTDPRITPVPEAELEYVLTRLSAGDPHRPALEEALRQASPPQPFPEHLAVVHRDDLELAVGHLRVCATSPQHHPYIARLAASITPPGPFGWPPRRGDVWADKDGHLWFAQDRPGGHLLMARDDGAVDHPVHMAKSMDHLEYRRDQP